MAVNKVKQKRRLGKSLAQRRKQVANDRLSKAWRNIFAKAGVLQDFR